jgi:large subunit ribosomal protein L34e
MVAGKHRSRSAKRIHVRVPGSVSKLRFKAKKSGAAKCQLTGQVLNGMPRLTKAQSRNTSKSMKRPNRPFGGVLSAAAVKRVLIHRARD